MKIDQQTTLYFSKNLKQVNGRSTWIRDDAVAANDFKESIWFNDEYKKWIVGRLPITDIDLGGFITTHFTFMCPENVESNWNNQKPGEEGNVITLKCYGNCILNLLYFKKVHPG